MLFRVWHSAYFNPRSREGSDAQFLSNVVATLHFNPRSREGSDEKEGASFIKNVISIHAPAKGATGRT